MPLDLLPALFALAVATLFTPGPNNAMLAASGAHFGLRRTVPHLLGVATGFPFMLLIVGLFLAGLFQTSALLREALRWGGAVLLLYIAAKIAFSNGPAEKRDGLRPLTYLQAVAFQWINPKAWTMAVAAASQFILADRPLTSALIVTVVFLGLGFFSATTWVLTGQSIARWLTTARRMRAFNLCMAGLIVLSVVQLVAS